MTNIVNFTESGIAAVMAAEMDSLKERLEVTHRRNEHLAKALIEANQEIKRLRGQLDRVLQELADE